jgi:hypothetical protein
MRLPLLSFLAAVIAVPAFADVGVKYPEKFRTDFHVKSMVINQGHPLYDAVGGIHHIYANKKALEGYRAANKFPDGAVITFDLFEAIDKDNAVSEGARKAVVVMQRDSKKFAATDGWGYQVFDPKTRKGSLDAKAAADCHGCHMSVKQQGYVFSTLRD